MARASSGNPRQLLQGLVVAFLILEGQTQVVSDLVVGQLLTENIVKGVYGLPVGFLLIMNERDPELHRAVAWLLIKQSPVLPKRGIHILLLHIQLRQTLPKLAIPRIALQRLSVDPLRLIKFALCLEADPEGHQCRLEVRIPVPDVLKKQAGLFVMPL